MRLLLAALVASVLALAALWATGRQRGGPAVAGEEAPAAPASVLAAPADPPARQSSSFLRDPQTMDDVHRLRGQMAAASAEAIPELRELALSAESPIAVGTALGALGRLGALAGDAELLALLSDPRPRVRQDLVLALGQRGGDAGIASLVRAATGADQELRPLALQSIGAIGGPRAVAALTELRARGGWSADERVFLDLAAARAADPGLGRRQVPPEPVAPAALPDGVPGAWLGPERPQ